MPRPCRDHAATMPRPCRGHATTHTSCLAPHALSLAPQASRLASRCRRWPCSSRREVAEQNHAHARARADTQARLPLGLAVSCRATPHRVGVSRHVRLTRASHACVSRVRLTRASHACVSRVRLTRISRASIRGQDVGPEFCSGFVSIPVPTPRPRSRGRKTQKSPFRSRSHHRADRLGEVGDVERLREQPHPSERARLDRCMRFA